MEEELITKYVDCLISMGKASEAGDYRKNNRLYTIMISLTDLSKKPGGLSAEMVLEEWRSGRLKP